MCRSRHYPDWRNAVLPDIITVQITRGNVIDDFAADGQLAKAIPGFKPREPQRQMAVAVSEAIEASRPLVVEAGTGTGKTYAYLAPALRAKKGDYLHRLESAAGSALQPRSAHRRQSAQIHRETGAAQRALQLPVSRTS